MITKVTDAVKRFFKSKKSAPTLAVMGASLFFLSGTQSAEAATYTALSTGKFNDEAVWQPEYPGNVVEEGDTMIIKSNLDMNVDVIVKGAMIVDNDGKLTGNKYLIVLDNGLMMNKGITIVEGLTNRGIVYNKHILETNADMINTGKLLNNESMVIGNIMDNTGTVTGNGGHLVANSQLVNAEGGAILGNIDICSSNFMNVGGARLDSTNISFCGNRIFNDVYLTANFKKDHIVLSLLNSENKQYKNYQIEKSQDGENYELVASIEGTENTQEPGEAFRYLADNSAGGEKVYYRMKITQNDGSEKILPAVEVGTVLAVR